MNTVRTGTARYQGSARTALAASSQSGFTLLELSIVLVIIAVVLGGGMAIFAAALKREQFDQTNMRLAFIQKTLLDYRRAFNRLPCPADAGIAPDAQYFGVEAQNPGTCSGTPAANEGVATVADPAHFVYYGMVPTKALKIRDEYAFDGWGRRILYVVDGPATLVDAFVNDPKLTDITYDAAHSVERLQIMNPSGGGQFYTISALYGMVSFGPNGHGAWTRLGADRISVGSQNLLEQQNCRCGESPDPFSLPALLAGNNLYMSEPLTDPDAPLNSFDDIVVFATRVDLRNETE